VSRTPGRHAAPPRHRKPSRSSPAIPARTTGDAALEIAGPRPGTVGPAPAAAGPGHEPAGDERADGIPEVAAADRKPQAARPAWRQQKTRIAVAATAGSVLLVASWPAAAHWLARAPRTAGTGRTDALGLPSGDPRRGSATPKPATPSAQPVRQADIASVAIARDPAPSSAPAQAAPASPASHTGQASPAGSGYLNPLRAVSGLVPERIDEGVDFSGAGPVYALGDGVVTAAESGSGWPGGGWITYQLTDGPDAGLVVYVAEDVTPDVAPGQHVTPGTVVGTMFAGADGIETGWAQASVPDAESDTPAAGGIGAGGPYPTLVGISFDQVLQSVGVPAAPNYGQSGYGLLPAGYPS
jgi:murein DD-endopeptidase MepM/ murein hydrolase activator NlpD